MSDRIMNLYNLQVGKNYRLVTNAGYFNKICNFKGFEFDFAIFLNEVGHIERVHTSFLWCYDNPIIITPV